MSSETLHLRRALLGWYRRHRRPLPWRATRDPYRIWVSEVMLQQTQVAAASPYYGVFLRRFPTLSALARAREDEVLAAWSGLGYYRRARHLRAAARRVARHHGGRVPRDPVAFRTLPGVGRYTAGAVLSIAFDQPLPVLDGNVARVLSRLFALRASVKNPRGAKRLWKLAGSLVPMLRPGEWNQALMELGALVCTPRTPRCESCPVRRWCRARASGRPEAFPPATPRRKTVRVRRAVAWIEHGGRVLMVKRTGSLLAGLWEPPGVDLVNGEPVAVSLAAELRRLGLRATLTPTERSVRHTITHRRIHVQTWQGELHGRARHSTTLAYVDPVRPAVAITGLARKLARALGAARLLTLLLIAVHSWTSDAESQSSPFRMDSVQVGSQAILPPSGAAARKPVRVRIHWSDVGRSFQLAENAQAISGDSLVLAPSDSSAQLRVAITNLKRMEVSQGVRRYGARGALIGCALGLVLGGLAYGAYTSSPLTSNPSNENAPVLTVMGGVVAGALLGAGIGSLIRSERWQRVDRHELENRLEAAGTPSTSEP